MNNNWEPSDKDVQWLVNLLDKLKIGGLWMAPSYGVIYIKKDANTLALQPPLIANTEAIEMIARTRKVAEKAGIYITEHEAMPILPPTPFEAEEKKYKCEDCGAGLTEDEKIKMSDEKTILCSQCLWTGRGGLNSKSPDE